MEQQEERLGRPSWLPGVVETGDTNFNSTANYWKSFWPHASKDRQIGMADKRDTPRQATVRALSCNTKTATCSSLKNKGAWKVLEPSLPTSKF